MLAETMNSSSVGNSTTGAGAGGASAGAGAGAGGAAFASVNFKTSLRHERITFTAASTVGRASALMLASSRARDSMRAINASK